jgi:hypothetical protein
MRRSLRMLDGYGLDVRLVSYSTPSSEILKMTEDFGGTNP